MKAMNYTKEYTNLIYKRYKNYLSAGFDDRYSFIFYIKGEHVEDGRNITQPIEMSLKPGFKKSDIESAVDWAIKLFASGKVKPVVCIVGFPKLIERGDIDEKK